MESSETSSSPRPAPPRRTVAIVACGAVVALLLTALIASFTLRDRSTHDAGDPGDGTSGEVAPPRNGEPDGPKMLATEVATPDGNPTTVAAQAKGKPMLVNLWSHTCAPCIREMPWLESISQANADVQVVGVSSLDLPGPAARMAERTGITYPYVLDAAGDVANAARSVGLPDTFLVATDGRVVASKTGAFKSRQAIQDWLDEHLPKAAS